MAEMRNACKILSYRTQSNDTLGKLRCKHKNNIKQPKRYGAKGVKWIHLAQGRDKWLALVNPVANLWIDKLDNYQTLRESIAWS